MSPSSLDQQESCDRRQPPDNPNDENDNEEYGDTTTTNEEEEEGCLFSCRCESARSVSTLLSCLRHVGTLGSSDGGDGNKASSAASSASSSPVTVFCSPTSITFHVYGKARQSQASVDIQAGLFSEYNVRKQPPQPQSNKNNNQEKDGGGDDAEWQAGGEFCVNLNTVLECLHVLGSTGLETTRLCLSYDSITEIFRMELLDDRGVLSTAAIPGVVPEHSNASLALAFRSAPIVARMMIKSDILKEAMQELESVHGATCCTIALFPNEIELAAVGDAGECLVSLPAGGTVSLESSTKKARTYPLHSFRSGMRALDIAAETCVSINDEGMMAIQHQVLDTVGKGSPNFVDFIMGCLEDEDEDDDVVDANTAASFTQQSESIASTKQHLGGGNSSYHVDNSTTPTQTSAQNNPLRTFESDQEHTDQGDNDSDNDDNNPAIVSSVQPLFGTLTFGDVSQKSSRGRNKEYKYGRKRSSRVSRQIPTERRTKVNSSIARGDDSSDSSNDGSRALIDDESDDSQHEESLDVTASARTPQRRRRISAPENEDGSSSPEVVYGEASLGF